MKKRKSLSGVQLSVPHGPWNSWNSSGQNTGVGSLSFLQGIFPTKGSNPGLSHCGQILYQLSHKGSPRRLEWVVYPFSSRSSWPSNRTRVSCIAGGFFIWRLRPNLLVACLIFTFIFFFFFLPTEPWLSWGLQCNQLKHVFHSLSYRGK